MLTRARRNNNKSKRKFRKRKSQIWTNFFKILFVDAYDLNFSLALFKFVLLSKFPLISLKSLHGNLSFEAIMYYSNTTSWQ